MNEGQRQRKQLENYSAAVAMDEEALKLAEDAFGPNHPDVGRVLGHLSNDYYYLGRYADAEATMQRSLDLLRNSGSAKPEELGASFHGLGHSQFKQRNYEEAQANLLRSIDLNRTHNPCLASFSLSRVSVAYVERGNLAIAEKYAQDAQNVARQGSCGVPRAQILAVQAMIEREKGNYREAETLYEKALAIMETELGRESIFIAEILGDMGLLYAKQGDRVRAQQALSRAVAIQEKRLPASHPDLTRNRQSLAALS